MLEIQKVNALTTRVKKPSVKILIGRVKIRNSGLKTALIIPKITEKKRAEKKLFIWIPGIF